MRRHAATLALVMLALINLGPLLYMLWLSSHDVVVDAAAGARASSGADRGGASGSPRR